MQTPDTLGRCGEGPLTTRCSQFPHDTGWTAVGPFADIRTVEMGNWCGRSLVASVPRIIWAISEATQPAPGRLSECEPPRPPVEQLIPFNLLEWNSFFHLGQDLADHSGHRMPEPDVVRQLPDVVGRMPREPLP